VFPGETLKIELWKESDLRVLLRATVVERNKVCISNAAVEFYPEIPKPKSKPPVAAAAPGAPAAAPAEITAAMTFDAISAHVSRNPELTKINMVYQFNLSGPDSSWVIDLKAGKVSSGKAEKADCTLALTNADWLDMVSGKADSMKLFQGGKLKITGNVMASQKLEFLKKLDRSSMPAASAAAAPAASAAPQGNSAEVLAPKVFKALQERIAKNPALAKEVNSVISFKVKDAGFEFTADLASATPSIKPGVDAKGKPKTITPKVWMSSTIAGTDGEK
jgi:3-hydroxyacyl-CoA dehydrogenase/3a,7a,12a-trihydroxy-5b-cholest-24-enoyl-CoA hydratase